jgi:DNA-binding XRE family transcriptional regulator
MRLIGVTSKGDYIIESTPSEWYELFVKSAPDADLLNLETLAIQLVAYREKNNLSQTKMAAMIGMSRGRYNAVENCNADDLKLRTYLKILKVLSENPQPSRG